MKEEKPTKKYGAPFVVGDTTGTGDEGTRLTDGFATLINVAGMDFWEVDVQPPGIDGGEPIDTTTMHNTVWRTFAPRQLKTLTAARFRAAYNPDVYESIVDQINNNQLVTITFPDAQVLTFYGYIKSFEPDGLEEGKMPTANMVLQPTNTDANGDEIAPTVT